MFTVQSIVVTPDSLDNIHTSLTVGVTASDAGGTSATFGIFNPQGVAVGGWGINDGYTEQIHDLKFYPIDFGFPLDILTEGEYTIACFDDDNSVVTWDGVTSELAAVLAVRPQNATFTFVSPAPMQVTIQNGGASILCTPADSVNYGSAMVLASEGAETDGIDFRYNGYTAGSENADPYLANSYSAGLYAFMDIPKAYLVAIDQFGTGGLSDYLTVPQCQGLGYNGFVPKFFAASNGSAFVTTNSLLIDSNGGYKYLEKSSEPLLAMAGDTSVTIEFWLKSNELWSGAGTIHQLCGNFSQPQNKGWGVYAEGNGSTPGSHIITFNLGDGTNHIQANTQHTDFTNWRHVACVMKPGATAGTVKQEIYIDGVAVGINNADSTFTGLADPDISLRIGRGASAPDAWQDNPTAKFYIDDVRVWNKERFQSEIQASMNAELFGSESGLVAYYKLDGDGTDSGPNGFHMTAVGNILFSEVTVVTEEPERNVLPIVSLLHSTPAKPAGKEVTTSSNQKLDITGEGLEVTEVVLFSSSLLTAAFSERLPLPTGVTTGSAKVMLQYVNPDTEMAAVEVAKFEVTPAMLNAAVGNHVVLGTIPAGSTFIGVQFVKPQDFNGSPSYARLWVGLKM